VRRRIAGPGGRADLAAWALLGLVCGASAVTLLVLGTRLTFFNDDWYFLVQRPGVTADSLFAPHNGHLSTLTILLYKGLAALFGLGSQLPFRLVLSAGVVSVGILVLLLVSERAGRFLGLVASTIVVFLGPAWEDLLWSFQIGLVGSLATGLAALLALERDTPRRNAVACLLLVCSISFSDVGIPFVVAAAVAIALRRRPAQLWIPAVPAALFGVWWIAYGSDAKSYLSAANVEHLPRYLLDSIANGLASIAGVHSGSVTGTSGWGLALLVIAAVGIAAWLVRGGRPSAWLLVFAAAALAFWVLAGANFMLGREPVASRYQLIDATLLILIAAELFRPVRLRPWAAAAVAAVALVAVVSNVRELREGYDFLRVHSAAAKVDLGALEIARGRVPGNFQLFQVVAHDPYLTGITADRYFRETAAHGSPAVYSPGQLAAAAPPLRRAADGILAAAYRMLPRPATRTHLSRGCRRVQAGAGGGADVEIARPGVAISNTGRSPLAIGVRRFAPPDLAVSVGTLQAGAAARIPVPRDSTSVPWHLTARGASALAICPLAATG
jgi:hypothetical protein